MLFAINAMPWPSTQRIRNDTTASPAAGRSSTGSTEYGFALLKRYLPGWLLGRLLDLVGKRQVVQLVEDDGALSFIQIMEFP